MQIHKQKALQAKESDIEPERPGTYDLGPRPGTYDLKPRDEESKSDQVSGDDGVSSAPKKSPKTPRSKSSNGHGSRRAQTANKVTPTRKTWSKHSSSKKVDKWWKEQYDLSTLSDGNHAKNVMRNDRKTWGKSSQIKTIKGNRKRRLYMLKNTGNLLKFKFDFIKLFLNS